MLHAYLRDARRDYTEARLKQGEMKRTLNNLQ